MTRDDIIRMASESLNECEGTDYYDYTHNLHWWGKADELVKFAELIAAAERESILDMCKEGLWDGEGIRFHLEKMNKQAEKNGEEL